MGNILSYTYDNTIRKLFIIMGNKIYGNKHQKSIEYKQDDVKRETKQKESINDNKLSNPSPIGSLFKRRNSLPKNKKNEVVDGNLSTKPKQSVPKEIKTPSYPTSQNTSQTSKEKKEFVEKFTSNSEFNGKNLVEYSTENKFPSIEDRPLSTYDNVPALSKNQKDSKNYVKDRQGQKIKDDKINNEKKSSSEKCYKNYEDSSKLKKQATTKDDSNCSTDELKCKKVAKTSISTQESNYSRKEYQGYNNNEKISYTFENQVFPQELNKSDQSTVKQILPDIKHMDSKNQENEKQILSENVKENNAPRTSTTSEIEPSPIFIKLIKESSIKSSENNINKQSDFDKNFTNLTGENNEKVHKVKDQTPMHKCMEDLIKPIETVSPLPKNKSNYIAKQTDFDESSTNLPELNSQNEQKAIKVIQRVESTSKKTTVEEKSKTTTETDQLQGPESSRKIEIVENPIRINVPLPKLESPEKTSEVNYKAKQLQPDLQKDLPIETKLEISPEKQKSLDQIEDIKLDALKYSDEVDQFSGTENDKEFIYLDEMLTRNLLKLDNVEIYGDKTIRQIRREVIKFNHQILMKLRKTVEEFQEKMEMIKKDLLEAENQEKINNEENQEQENNVDQVRKMSTEKRKNVEHTEHKECKPVNKQPSLPKSKKSKSTSKRNEEKMDTS